LKWRRISGTISNLSADKPLQVRFSRYAFQRSFDHNINSMSQYQPALAAGATSYTYDGYVLDGNYTCGAFCDANTSGLLGDRIGFYNAGLSLKEPAAIAITSDRTDLNFSLNLIATVSTVSGKVSFASNKDGKGYRISLNTLTAPYNNWMPLESPILNGTNTLPLLSGGVLVNNRYEYPFSVEVPADSSYLCEVIVESGVRNAGGTGFDGGASSQITGGNMRSYTTNTALTHTLYAP